MMNEKYDQSMLMPLHQAKCRKLILKLKVNGEGSHYTFGL
jgi:hypothetical protein